MNKNTLDAIRILSENDKKTLCQKALKTAEEVGELAKVVLPFEGAGATTHRFVDKTRILDSVADIILCARSIAYHLEFDDNEIEDMIIHKMRKWSGLQSRERDAKYPVPYEFHITVKTDDVDHFRAACQKVGVKPIIIDLQDQIGDSVMHDVMTSSTFMGENPGAYAEMERIAKAMEDDGLKVIRKKIETVPWHPAAPDSEGDAESDQCMPKDCYFEAHIAVVCNESRRAELYEFAEKSKAHLSRNIFKKIDPDNFKIMLTARAYDGTATSFKRRVDAMESSLKDLKFDVDKVIIEFSVYDTRVSHDSSWISK